MAGRSEHEDVQHPRHTPSEGNLSAAASHLQAGARNALAESGLEREGPSLATAALVGVGVALLEPELIPGILIGAGAVLVPKLLPNIGSMLRPLVKGVVKAGYSVSVTAREMVAEAGEQVEDLVAEARAEHGQGGTARRESPAEPARGKRTGRPSPSANL